MIIRTISGSRYEIAEDGVCTKYNPEGRRVDAFKVYITKAVPTTAKFLGDVWDIPNSEPEVGKLLYIAGKDSSWISTEVIAIEYDDPSRLPDRFRDVSNGE